MKAIEIGGQIDEKGLLKIDHPLQLINKQVKIIILVPEDDEIEDVTWLRANSSNPAFDFLKEKEEDIYSITDGEPITGEV